MQLTAIFRYTPSFILILWLMALPAESQAQRRRASDFQNRIEHDNRPYHFGFTLGYSSLGFALRPAEGYDDTFEAIYAPKWETGIHIGVLSNLKLNELLDLRFVPTYVFNGAFFNGRPIRFVDASRTEEPVYEANIIELPLHLKLKSQRYTNTRAFVTGGLKYAYNTQSNKLFIEGGTATGNDIIFASMNPHDYQWELGFGIEYYFPYFKFGAELKGSFGLRNLISPDPEANPRYVDNISRLSSRSLMISIYIE